MRAISGIYCDSLSAKPAIGFGGGGAGYLENRDRRGRRRRRARSLSPLSRLVTTFIAHALYSKITFIPYFMCPLSRFRPPLLSFSPPHRTQWSFSDPPQIESIILGVNPEWSELLLIGDHEVCGG